MMNAKDFWITSFEPSRRKVADVYVPKGTPGTGEPILTLITACEFAEAYAKRNDCAPDCEFSAGHQQEHPCGRKISACTICGKSFNRDPEICFDCERAGSAETGGEKAALRLSEWGRPIIYIAESSWYSGVTTNQCVFSSREEAVRWAKDQGRGFLDWDTWAPRGKYPDCEFDSEQFDPTFFAKWDDGFVRVIKTEVNENKE